MSIVRKSPVSSDIYIILIDDDNWQCELRSSTDEFVTLRSSEEVIAHMDKHRDAGHKVPEYAYERMRDKAYWDELRG